MASTSIREYGKVFDAVASEYERNRPAYPDELVDRACELASLCRGDRVLELGCGTGQLTRSLVARGLRVTAVEPGERLISHAKENLDDEGETEFVNARFEDTELPERFRAVFSAAAFQWIEPRVSWEKAARLLAPGGTLALVQYCGLEDERCAADHAALLGALARVAPELAADWPVYRDLPALLAGAEQRRKNVSEMWAWIGTHDVARPEASRLFCDTQLATRPKAIEQSAEELNALLRTASFYQRMAPAQRGALEAEHVALGKCLGRPIRSSLVAVLLTARRSDAAV